MTRKHLIVSAVFTLLAVLLVGYSLWNTKKAVSDEINPLLASESIKKEIELVSAAFFKALSENNGAAAVHYLSASTTDYYTDIIEIAKYVDKASLEKREPMIILSVLSMRGLKKDKELLRLSGQDFFVHMVNTGFGTEVQKTINLKKIKITEVRQVGEKVIAYYTEGGTTPSLQLVFRREDGTYKIDIALALTAVNTVLRTQIETLAKRMSYTKTQIIEMFVSNILPELEKAEIEALWVPLVARTDIQAADEIVLVTYTDPVYGFSIDYPKGWEVVGDETPEDTVYSVFFIAPDSFSKGLRLRGSVTVNVFKVESGTTIHTAFMDSMKAIQNNAQTTDSAWVVTDSKQVTFLGRAAYEYYSTKLRTFDNGKTYVRQKNKDIEFVVGNLGFDLAYKHGIDSFEELKPLGERILSTFRIK